jgi:hypothetical protein
MNTYLVRTKSDQTLIGMFCAESVTNLARLIDEVFEASECEYLELKNNEGLFVEAKFVTMPTQAGDAERVMLTNVDDIAIPDLDEEEIAEAMGGSAEIADLIVEGGADEHIPPVLEPTQALSRRFQSAHRLREWQPVVAASEQAEASSIRVDGASQMKPLLIYSAPCAAAAGTRLSTYAGTAPHINAERIANKLMKGELNPASFLYNGSRLVH